MTMRLSSATRDGASRHEGAGVHWRGEKQRKKSDAPLLHGISPHGRG
eukprot:CAMPEP_0198448058 /NCGR_PEP_ID=MMETSP1453-20131121/3103_1 /TAXON_ID=1461543 ORGANISM="Unidentified sp., Strain RCC701" /NCGR_SAMPLE_ID=MMETSP1453 /ASSEMBLY_ACC=CAM_ASM_001118 /LENGTH=46 /DNA_ID= /DNA_START= /DNA_END= /DNA_ORIENTATION=